MRTKFTLVTAGCLVMLASALSAATFTVTSTADSGTGTLRAALASAGNGDTIDVTGISGTILLTGGELLVPNSVTILGPGPANLAVNGNAASRVFNISGTVVTISGLTITNGNASGGFGGGIYNAATLTVSASTLSGNSAGSGGFGGGIFNQGTVQIVTSTLRSNSASYGGGIFNQGTVQIVTSTLSGNSAGFGGGVYNAAYGGGARLTFSASTLSGNSAGSGFGGGIYNAAYSGSATLTFSASTLSGNSAGFGGGIYNDAFGGSASLEIGSSILKAGAGGTIVSGIVISDGYNLTSDDGGGFLTGTSDQINTDPMLGPLQDNGGPTFTHALLPGSPAIDKGKNLTGSATDQRGLPRTVDEPCIANTPGGDGTDIGAFEVQQPCSAPPSTGNIGVVVWNANISDTFLNVRGSPVVVGQIAVNLTQPGRVLVQFDGDCFCDVGDRIVLAASDALDWSANDGSVGVMAASAAANGESFSHSRVYAVAAGPHTFYAVAQNYVDEGGSGTASIYGALKVKFFPSTTVSADVGFDGISLTGINVRGAPVTVGTVTIQAPMSGKVIVHFDGECYSSVGDRIVLAASDTPHWSPNDGSVGVKAVSAAFDFQTFSHSRVYAVTAGSHTFYAVAQNTVEQGGTGIASIYGSLTVEFVPEDSILPLLTSQGIADTLINLRGSPVTLATLTLTAPTAGDVVVHFDGTCISDVGDQIVLAASDTTDWGVNDGNVSVVAPSAGVPRQCFSHSRVYHVLAGALNFYAVAQNYVQESGSGIASIYANFTAEFFLPVPFTLRAVFAPTTRTFTVLVWGPSGASARLQRSTDLLNWTDWQSITLATQPFEIMDPDWSSAPHRFYRVVSP